jgi:hypothetical protein
MVGLKARIKANREAADKARQLASQLSLREERERVLACAEALDAQADALESGRATPSPISGSV